MINPLNAKVESGLRNEMPEKTKVKTLVPFTALSGLSWITLGMAAMIGVGFAWVYLDYHYEGRFENDQLFGNMEAIPTKYVLVLGPAALLFGLTALGIASYFTRRKATRMGASLREQAVSMWLSDLSIPLLAGAAFGAILIFHFGLFGLAAPVSLIFYGIALTHSSYYTLSGIRYLGFAEILLGLASCMMPRESLIFWGIGFGLFHVLFGVWFYWKHDV